MTARWMLDTNMASALIKGQAPAARERLQKTIPAEVCISVVTEAEILFGLEKSPATKHADAARAFLAAISVPPWISQTASVYARLRTGLEAAGRPLGALDLMIAAHALSIGCALVTADKAFRSAEGLVVEFWN